MTYPDQVRTGPRGSAALRCKKAAGCPAHITAPTCWIFLTLSRPSVRPFFRSEDPLTEPMENHGTNAIAIEVSLILRPRAKAGGGVAGARSSLLRKTRMVPPTAKRRPESV